jgi:hypothetical protein
MLISALALSGSPVVGQDSVTVVAGDYSAGWLKRIFFGGDYRDLWTTPIRVPYLDLQGFAGGLTPVRTGGFGQTISLHFDGADGRRYVFRSIDKDLSRRLEEGLLGTFVEDIIQDQTSAYNPVAALVASPLVEAAGVLAAKPEMFVMPDDPALGEFREGYAGMLGMIMENPDEGQDNTPGFAGSNRVSGSDRIFEDTEESPRNRVDAVGFLKARLLDVYLGDRDRHKGQWKWARFEEGDGYRWEVVAEDRDQPFVKQDGILLWVARTFFVRKLTNFSANYSNLVGLTWNGWDLDRRFFAELEKPVWDSVATDLQRRFTDEVIEDAVRKLPPEYYALRGAELTYELKNRRDHLLEVADEYYRLMAEYIQIHATDEDEIATIDRNDDGSVLVEVALTPTAEPHFRRMFYPGATREIRLHLHGGEDRAVVRGNSGDIKIRVIGGGGPDHLADASSKAVYFYDTGAQTEFVRGSGTRVDQQDFEAPPSPDFAHEHPPDWGHWVKPGPWASFGPDIGLFAGAGFNRFQYGFRKFPYSSRVTLRAGYAFGAEQPSVAFQFEKRELRPNVHFDVAASWTGLDIINFYGFGNNTTTPGSSDFYRVKRRETSLAMGFAVEPSEHVIVSASPVFHVSKTDRDDDATFLGNQGPDFYGVGTFEQLGVQASFRIDTRDRPLSSTKGVLITGGGSVYGPYFDVTDTYGEVHADAATYLTPGPTFAFRAGAKKVFGPFPFHDAAYLGGTSTIRGFAEQRFAGHAAVWGNAEFRFRASRLRIIFPGNIGLFGLADVGRVFSDFDTPGENTWHAAYGGGVWLSVLGDLNTTSFAIVRSEELTGVYMRSGFHF